MFYFTLDSISLAQLLSPKFSMFSYLSNSVVESLCSHVLCFLQIMMHLKAWVLVFCLKHPQSHVLIAQHTLVTEWGKEGQILAVVACYVTTLMNLLFPEFFIGFSKALLSPHLSLISPSAHFCFLDSFSQVLIPNKYFVNYFNLQLRLKKCRGTIQSKLKFGL